MYGRRQGSKYWERGMAGSTPYHSGVRKGARGCGPQFLHDSPQTVLQCQERPSWVLKIVETRWSGLCPEPRYGSLQRPRPHNWWGGVAAPSPRTRPPLSAFGPSVMAPMKSPGHALAKPAWVSMVTRLRFARDLWRFTNVLWLIDWLACRIRSLSSQMALRRSTYS